MERVRVADLHDSPYGGARFLYNDCNQQKTETVDLLQMVPSMSRPPGILKNVDSSIPKEESATTTMMQEEENLDCNNKPNNKRRGSRKSLGDYRCGGKNNADDEVGIEMIHTNGSGPCHVDLPDQGPPCLPPQRNMMVYCSREALEDEQQHPPHLCHKHARELLDNQTNSLYDQHHQRVGHCNNGEDPYYTKVPPHLYNNREQVSGFGTEGRGGGTNVHFNYLKQMKQQQPKDRNQSRSTLSLPAVTYTFGKKGHNANKNIFRKTSNFFKPSCGNNAGKSYAPTEDFLDSKKKTSSKDFSKFKRLLLVACILMGVVLAIGGIIIGFVILQSQTQTPQDCGPDYVDCGELGCIHLDDVCNDVINQCPDYTLGALCKHTIQDNTSSSVDVLPDEIQQNKSISVISKFIYDESNWVHFTNFSGAESMYQVIDKYMTFTSAQEECRGYGGHLAHVTSVREQVFLEDYIRSQYPTPESLSGVRGFWIGARRQRGSNPKNCLQYRQWRWLDSHGLVYGVMEGFSAFKDGKPDNFYNPEECLFMNTETAEPGVYDESFLKWDDLPCDLQGQSGLKPLCEVDLKRYPYTS